MNFVDKNENTQIDAVAVWQNKVKTKYEEKLDNSAFVCGYAMHD